MSGTFEGERICYIEPFDPESSTIDYREPIVRCIDCADSAMGATGYGAPVLVCKRFSAYNFKTEPDRFCAWGRKVDA